LMCLRLSDHFIPVGIYLGAVDRRCQVNYLPNSLEMRVPMATGRPREFDLEQALDRAMELFWRKGYEGTSLTDLTDTLGITRPSLCAALGNKEALFRTVLKRYEANVVTYRPKAVNAPTAREVARELLEGAANFFGDKSKPPGCLGVQGALACGEA